MRNMKIRTKLMLLGMISVLGLFILGGESITTINQINQVSKEFNEVWINAVVIAEELNTTTSDYRIQESRHAITIDSGLMEELEDTLFRLEQEIERKFDIYKKLPTNAEDQQIIEQAEEVWGRYLKCSQNLIRTSRGNDREKATEMMMGESQVLFNEASELFLKAVELTKRTAESEQYQAELLYDRLSQIKIFVIAVVSLIVVGLSIYLIRSIGKPMAELTETARRATSGNLDMHFDYEAKDEIGVLTEAMNLLIKRLKDIIQDEIWMFQEIGNENFDVKSRCEQAYRGDFAPILYAFASLQSRLKGMDRQQDEQILRLKEENRRQKEEIETLKAKINESKE